MKKIINVAKDFNEFPGLRHCSLSDSSGEQFYHEVLNPIFAEAINERVILEVNLDYTAGYAPSFLDEAFGNLVYDFTLNLVKDNLSIITNEEPSWKEMIFDRTFLEWEERRINNTPPRITGDYKTRFVYSDGRIIKSEYD